MEWHFHPETGSPFWLERAKSLNFDPRKDIKRLEDLELFPVIEDQSLMQRCNLDLHIKVE
jgi:phenylacetate-coenzyme A ligase PaaK-like adenylate-forming protein